MKKNFSQLLEQKIKEATKYFKPNLNYSKKYDILSISFRGNKRYYSSVEVDLKGKTMVIDVDKKGNILGLEIFDISELLNTQPEQMEDSENTSSFATSEKSKSRREEYPSINASHTLAEKKGKNEKWVKS